MRWVSKFVHIEPPLSDWKSVSKTKALIVESGAPDCSESVDGGACPADTGQRLGVGVMGVPVKRPQREVIFRQGPWAGTTGLIEIDCIEISFDDDGRSVTYQQDPDFKEYFMFVESHD